MLTSRTVLVVETEFIIALGIQGVLESMGASQVIVTTSAAEALALSPSWKSSALAIVELESTKPDMIELARRISQSGIPVLGLSADMRLAFGVPELPGTPVILKPIPDEELATAITGRLRQNPLPEVT